MKNMNIYTDKEQKKVIIVADREFLSDMRAACIAYCCHWIEDSKEAIDESCYKRDRRLANKYDEYYSIFYDAAEQLKQE